jgi:hypothetical protein
MTARKRLPALIASAALGALAAPAFAETIYIETSPSDYVYVPPPTTYYYYTAPAPTVVYTEPPIVVTPRDDDASINQGVVDTLAADPYLSGRIGVETRDREVELSGIVTTDGQTMRAERDAKSVYGVRNVQNNLTTRIGPHTH